MHVHGNDRYGNQRVHSFVYFLKLVADEMFHHLDIEVVNREVQGACTVVTVVY